jgi:conjugative transfer region protein TrbK
MIRMSLARAASHTMLAAAVATSAMSCSQRSTAAAGQSGEGAGGSLQSELQRCHDLGVKASEDPACQDAWNRSNAHFFGTDRPGKAP